MAGVLNVSLNYSLVIQSCNYTCFIVVPFIIYVQPRVENMQIEHSRGDLFSLKCAKCLELKPRGQCTVCLQTKARAFILILYDDMISLKRKVGQKNGQ